MTRFGYVMTTYFALLGFAVTAIFPVSPKLIWNASASVPIGLYAMRPAGALHVTELVVVPPPAALASFLDRAPLPAQGRADAEAHPRPARPNRLPHPTARSPSTASPWARRSTATEVAARCPTWQGCRVVAADEVFLMNWQSEDSFDGRYFGPLPVSTIVGRADPLWTREED